MRQKFHICYGQEEKSIILSIVWWPCFQVSKIAVNCAEVSLSDLPLPSSSLIKRHRHLWGKAEKDPEGPGWAGGVICRQFWGRNCCEIWDFVKINTPAVQITFAILSERPYRLWFYMFWNGFYTRKSQFSCNYWNPQFLLLLLLIS